MRRVAVLAGRATGHTDPALAFADLTFDVLLAKSGAVRLARLVAFYRVALARPSHMVEALGQRDGAALAVLREAQVPRELGLHAEAFGPAAAKQQTLRSDAQAPVLACACVCPVRSGVTPVPSDVIRLCRVAPAEFAPVERAGRFLAKAMMFVAVWCLASPVQERVFEKSVPVAAEVAL